MIRNLDKSERPREKMLHLGPENLTDSELLAIIIRSGTTNTSAITLSQSILKETKGIKNLLNMTTQELSAFSGIGVAKACSIKASCELVKRIQEEKHSSVRLLTPVDAYHFFKNKLYAKTEEHLLLTSLDAKQKVISCDLVTKGTVNNSLISPRDIYKIALKRNAVSVILAHNHPSNEPTPSPQDISVTKVVAEVGHTLGIPLVDHLIITDSDYTSLKNYL